jgi:hypothetical protein
MTRFGPYFAKVPILVFFIGLIFFPPNMYNKKFLNGQPFIWTLLIDYSSHRAHKILVLNIFSHFNVIFSIYMDFWDKDFCRF